MDHARATADTSRAKKRVESNSAKPPPLFTAISLAPIDRLSVLLSEIDAGDKVIYGKLEAFEFDGRTAVPDKNSLPEKKFKSDVYDENLISADFLRTLGATLNQTYPDFTFPETADSFQIETDFTVVCTQINHLFALGIERVIPGFLREFWLQVSESVDLRSAAVISLRRAGEGLASLQCEAATANGAASVTTSLDFFFTDLRKGRILYLSCACRPSHLLKDDDSNNDSSSSRCSAAFSRSSSEISASLIRDDSSDDE